ncbi:MAG: GNAT family N-acetyltransferase [Bacteroidetes bacterium]|nr:GNAT family N-acetyltransferase [Bacteroidota bacterium]
MGPKGLPVETERLLIRPMAVEDAAFILELLNEPTFLANIGDKQVRSLEDALGYIQTAGWDNYDRFGFGMNTVELNDSSTRIGICGLLQRDWLDLPDLGFAYLASFHGQGLATEAAGAMLEVAFDALGLSGVCAITSMTNDASVGVLTKNGFAEGPPIQKPPDGPKIRYLERSRP